MVSNLFDLWTQCVVEAPWHILDVYEYVPLDGLCDDGRCKDDRNMRRFLKLRKEEAEAVHNEKEMVKALLQICQELPQHVKGTQHLHTENKINA